MTTTLVNRLTNQWIGVKYMGARTDTIIVGARFCARTTVDGVVNVAHNSKLQADTLWMCQALGSGQ